VRFCDRYIDRRSRTHDQMVQAARSGVQNIAEGSAASGTSKKFELKLTNVGRASLEELKLDYEDFLRHRGLALWPIDDPRRRALVALRPKTADDFADWAREVRGKENGPGGPDGRNGQRAQREPSLGSMPSIGSIPFIPVPFPEIAANGAHALVGVACSLLERQVMRLARDFEDNGGFTERLCRVRSERKR
jgi:four helix bundle suffix protein